MSNWKIVVHYKPNFVDHRGESLKKEWRQAGFKAVKKIRTGQAYEISGDLSEGDVRRLVEKLLTDPITQEAEVARGGGAPSGFRRAEVWPKQGVADPVGDTVIVGARDLNVTGLKEARSGSVFDFRGPCAAGDIKAFCENHLMNSLIQRLEIS